jgi:hypothetical protein
MCCLPFVTQRSWPDARTGLGLNPRAQPSISAIESAVLARRVGFAVFQGILILASF